MPAEKQFKSVALNIKRETRVIGKTSISHSVRIALELTMTEYVFVDFINFWFNEIKKTEAITQAVLFYYTGIRPTMVRRLVQRCKSKGVITKNTIGDKIVMVPTDKWHKQFEKQDKFEDFWALRDKDKKTIHKGNKLAAQKMYKLTLKKLSAEDIKSHFLKYKKWCDETGTFQKHTSSWLNPGFEYWKDELTIEKKPEKGEQKTTTETLPEIDDW